MWRRGISVTGSAPSEVVRINRQCACVIGSRSIGTRLGRDDKVAPDEPCNRPSRCRLFVGPCEKLIFFGVTNKRRLATIEAGNQPAASSWV